MIVEILIFVLPICIYLIFRDRKPANMPPGPFEVPFFGSCMPMTTTADFEKHRRQYGSVFTVKCGALRSVCVSDYDLTKEAMASPDFADRPSLLRVLNLDPKEEGGLVGSNGTQWVHDRRFVLRHLRDLGMGKTYLEGAIHEEARALVENLKNLKEKPSLYPTALMACVLNVIWQMVASKRYEFDSKEIEIIFAMPDKVRKALLLSMMEIFFPAIKVILPSPIRRMVIDTTAIEEFRATMINIIQERIDENLVNLDESNPKDLIDEYLLDMKKCEGDPKSLYSYITLYQIVTDLFTAGSDTVANMLRWVIYYMHKYPEATSKCQVEIDAVVAPDNLVSILDKPRLPYVEAYLAEALRHSCLLYSGVQRNAVRDSNIGKYFIPKGTVVTVNAYFIHYDPQYWDNPESFRPERFLDANGNFQPKFGRTVAFGSGRRQCLGEPLARMEFFLFSTALLQNFTIQVPEGSKQDETIEDMMGFRKPVDQLYIYKIRNG